MAHAKRRHRESEMRKLSKKIKDLRLLLSLDQREFGKALNPPVDQTTVSKWENDKQKPTSEHIASLAGMAGITSQQFLGIPSPGEDASTGRRIRVVGQLAAGDWREAIEFPSDEQYDVPAPAIRQLHDADLLAYEIVGPSMNLVYPEGSIVYAAPTTQPISGERVVIQRVGTDGMYESTCKEYVMVDGKPWLYPRSSDPQHQAPIPFVDTKRKIKEITILGVVRAALIVEGGR